jgi:hypothetical protein
VQDVPEGGNLPSLTERFHKFRALVSLGNTSHSKLFFYIHPVYIGLLTVSGSRKSPYKLPIYVIFVMNCTTKFISIINLQFYSMEKDIFLKQYSKQTGRGSLIILFLRFCILLIKNDIFFD